MQYTLLRCVTILLIGCFLASDPALAVVQSVEIETESQTETEDKLESLVQLDITSSKKSKKSFLYKEDNLKVLSQNTLTVTPPELILYGSKRHLWIAQFRL